MWQYLINNLKKIYLMIVFITVIIYCILIGYVRFIRPQLYTAYSKIKIQKIENKIELNLKKDLPELLKNETFVEQVKKNISTDYIQKKVIVSNLLQLDKIIKFSFNETYDFLEINMEYTGIDKNIITTLERATKIAFEAYIKNKYEKLISENKVKIDSVKSYIKNYYDIREETKTIIIVSLSLGLAITMIYHSYLCKRKNYIG